MRQKKVSARELYRARLMQGRDIPQGDASRNSIAPAWLARSAPGLSLDEPVRAGKTCPEPGPKDVKRTDAKWLRPDGLVLATQGPVPG